MAANKVMTFWAMCLAVLGKLLASLGVSAPASAARREAALYERTLGTTDADAGTEPRGADDPGGADTPAPRTSVAAAPAAVTPAAAASALEPPVVEGPTVPAPRTVTRHDQAVPARLLLTRPELPPTIKQRIHAEAHGASPGLRSRCIRGVEPLSTACAGAAPQTTGTVNPRPAVIPAARRRAHTARTV